MKCGGIVLCGGLSSRMGQPKAWLPFGTELLLPRVVRILREVVDPIVAVAAPGQSLPPLPADVEIIYDREEGLGPLNGLASGLAALLNRVDAVYLSSCDVPFLRPEFVRRIIETLGEGDIAIPKAEGYLHPLAAVYRVRVLPTVRRLLDSGCRRLQALTDEVPTRIVEAHELEGIASLCNLNSPADYEAALKALREDP